MKKLALFLISTIFAANAFSAFLQNVPIDLKQPDGTIIHIFITGDEFHRRVHDKDNYTIIQNPQTGYYVYTLKQGEVLIPSEYVVGKSDPKQIGIEPNLDISVKEMEEKRTEILRTSNAQKSEKMLKSANNITEFTTKGNVNNIVISICFSDQNPTTLTIQDYEDRFNSETGVSLKSYFKEVSNSQLNVTSYFYPTPQNQKILEYQDSHPRSYYTAFNEVNNPIGFKNPSEEAERATALLKNAVKAVEDQIIETQINLDVDNDKCVDNTTFIIQGEADGWGNFLWPHTSIIFNSDVTIGNNLINICIISLSSMFDARTFCHEYFHMLNAPDLYHYSWNGINPVGSWDLMEYGKSHMTTYMKWKYGRWFDTIPEITKPGTYKLLPVSKSPFACYKITLNQSESLILEYRKKEGLLESTLPGNYKDGIIIYRINNQAFGNAAGPPDEVYLYRPQGNLTSNGDISQASFSTDVNRTVFNSTSDPYCFMSNGAPYKIDISNITYVGNEISFTINNLLNKAPVSIAGTDQIVNKVTVVSLDGSRSSDPEGDSLTYKWIAPDGIVLSSKTTSKTTFTAPDVDSYTNFTFTLVVNDGIVDSAPDEVVINVRKEIVNKVVSAGNLKALLTSDELNSITNLAITGTIDARDFKTMRDNMPMLAELDLSCSTILEYNGTEGTSTNGNTNYPANSLPQVAFHKIDINASVLTSVTIPSSVINLGFFAFANCTRLISLFVNWPLPLDLNSWDGIFSNVAKQTCILYVPYGSSSLYSIANEWKDFKNIIEMQGLKLSATSKTIEEADGSIASVEISSNVTWSASSDKTWLKISPTTGNGYQTITLTAEANFSNISRTANVIVSANGIKPQTIIITQKTSTPIANAGSDQSVSERTKVTLDGSASSDPNGNPLTYKWTAPIGITLSSTTAAKPIFTVPEVTSDTSFIFTLVVNNGTFYSIDDEVVINVHNIKGINVTAGNLASILTANQLATTTILKLTGTIDARDFKTMRDNMPMLSELDLSGATILAYNGTEGTSVNEKSNYPANTVPEAAFYNLYGSNLSSIVFPESITTISELAFINCTNLTTVTFPSSILTLGRFAFGNCIGLTSLFVGWPLPLNFDNCWEAFFNTNKKACILYVPYGSSSLYAIADEWKDFTNIKEMPGLELSTTKAIVGAIEGSELSIKLFSNASWTASSDQKWLAIDTINGTGNTTLTFAAQANPLKISRTAIVTISLNGLNSQTVTVTQETLNKVPVANAGTDLTVNEGVKVSLDASASSDPNGDTLTYKWTIPAEIKLSSTIEVNPTFTAPMVSSDTDYTFSLVVNDGIVDSHPDSVKILIKNICQTQTINFSSGWNIFSSPVVPDSTNMETIFQPLIKNVFLVKVQDEQGNSLEDWGIFGGWQNNIGDISPTEGYKIKVNRTDSVEICGVPVDYPFAVPMNIGWNIIGYPQTNTVDGLNVVQQLIDRGTMIKVQDETGNSIEDWGIFGGWQNNIGNFVPGEGYKIKVSAKDTLWVYDSYPKSSTVLPQIVATTHFQSEFEGNGVDHMNINLVELPVNLLKAGDELAIFDGTSCVGAVTIMPHHLKNKAVSIAASATDNQGMQGFQEGNKFTFKLWKSMNKQEFLLESEIVKGTSTFIKHETTVASLEKYATTGLEGLPGSGNTEINCYPNPFSDEITIEINLKIGAEVEVEILNQLGQRVKMISSKQQFNSGVHRLIWNGKNGDNGEVTPGIYHLRIKIDDLILNRKIVFSK